MAFQIANSDGKIKTEIWSCTNCNFLSTKKHFPKDDQEINCPLCKAECKYLEDKETTVGMSNFEYNRILDYLEENAAGIGQATVVNIEQMYDSGDKFLSICETAYDDAKFDKLTEISGIGKTSAKNLCLAVAEREGWSGGECEPIESDSFTFTQG